MTLASFAIMLIIFNTGFSLQNVLAESIENSVDRIIESAMDDNNVRDNDNNVRDANHLLSDEFLDGISDDFNDESSRVYVNFDED